MNKFPDNIQKIVETAITKQTYLVDDLRFTVHELNDLIERLLATQDTPSCEKCSRPMQSVRPGKFQCDCEDTGGGGELIEPNTCTCVQCDSWRRYAHALATRSQDTGEREAFEAGWLSRKRWSGVQTRTDNEKDQMEFDYARYLKDKSFANIDGDLVEDINSFLNAI